MANFSLLAWEDIESTEHEASDLLRGQVRISTTRRAKVPGGWLVQSLDAIVPALRDAPPMAGSVAGGLAFVPDPDHEWRAAVTEAVHEVFNSGFGR